MGAFGLSRLLALSACLIMAGCATPPSAPPETATTTAAAPPPAPSGPSAAPPPTPLVDHCGAADLQYLVGRSKSDIPVPVKPASRRVLCTTCPMTRDYREDRQTILFDEQTGLVTAVTCD